MFVWSSDFVPDSESITIIKLCDFRDRYMPVKGQLEQIQNGQFDAIFSLIWVISRKLCQIARCLPENNMCGFSEGYILTNVNSMNLYENRRYINTMIMIMIMIMIINLIK